MQSCEKKTLTDTENGIAKKEIVTADKSLQTSDNTIYYLDNKEVNKQIANFYTIANSYIIQTGILNKTNKEIINLVYIYTTKKGYIEYGIKHNLKLKEELQFAEHMSKYAETSGAISEYEKTGKISENYFKYEKKYYKKIFGKSYSAKSAFVLYDNRNQASGQHIIVPFFWMLPTLGKMNDKTSSVDMWGMGGVVTLYNKTFFRGYLTSMVMYPPLWWRKVPVSSDNRASSVVTH